MGSNGSIYNGTILERWTKTSAFNVIQGKHHKTCTCYVSICMHQVFQIAYCEFFAMSLYEEWSKICVAFVEAIKMHMPELLQKQKTHLILHLVDCMRELGPSSAFSAERYIHLRNLYCGLH